MTVEAWGAADHEIARGNGHEDQGAFEAALSCYLDATKIAPDYPRARLNLASALEHVDRIDDAVDALKLAITLDPTYVPARYNLGKLYASNRQYEAAERELGVALCLDPACVDAAIVLASVREAQGDAGEAEAQLRYAAAYGSGSAGAGHNLALMLSAQGRLDEAEHAYEKVLQLDSNSVNACVNLGNLWLRTRRARDAEALFRKALSIQPFHWDALSNLLFSMNVRDDLSPSAIHREHLRVAEVLESRIPQARVARRIDPEKRRLKIGYVSGDFGSHPVALFVGPVLANHDRANFESYCYCNNRPDLDPTREIRASSDHWRDISLLNDDQAASLIRADEIDVLVDLSGYTGSSRLPVFILRPAPLQVSWLGYLNTTGLRSMDYRISDRHADPVGTSEHLYSEKLFRLPHSQWCYQPAYRGSSSNERADDSTAIRFGSFNQFAKISDSCLALWCDILRQVPGSRLLVISVPSKSAEIALGNAVESHGIDPRRVETAPRISYPEYFAAIGNVDVALDTFPYNGATTTLDILWMGVPIVALPGSTAVGRSSLSILKSLGATELIAASASDYIAKNIALATDTDWRRTLRRSLSSRMKRSPLMDAQSFTRSLEEGYRAMWRERGNAGSVHQRG